MRIQRYIPIMLLLCAAARGRAAAAPVSPDVITTTPACVECHKKVVSSKFTHGPVGVKMCRVCHSDEKPAQDPAKHHVFSFPKPQPELCLECHVDVRESLRSGKMTHGAIEAGGCTSCHDPHGSGQKFFLRGENMDALCSNCHGKKTGGAVVHRPVKASCMLCHEPHASGGSHLLKTDTPELCLGCHQQVKTELSGKYVHGPVQTGCQTCHDPHSAPKPYLLKSDAKKELCLGCHADMAKALKNAKRPHPAVESAGCIGCHSPHASGQPKMLLKPMKELCLGCHADKAAELGSKFLHGPVRLNECQGCHDPHGADNPNILKEYFPEDFYNSYKEGLYALCFECHEKNIASEPRTAKLTNFRNGDVNLHYVHVHSEKGRSCKACHQVHGGRQEKHVRESVPFGSWPLPIVYRKTATGGSCNVGCHNPKSYDRVKEVENK
ncbi:MAG: cytochrome c3 family protein [Elusimicrobia bacterium]|nr:cytochrome c3 family protein [Elusimicrobiota bacterium]